MPRKYHRPAKYISEPEYPRAADSEAYVGESLAAFFSPDTNACRLMTADFLNRVLECSKEELTLLKDVAKAFAAGNRSSLLDFPMVGFAASITTIWQHGYFWGAAATLDQRARWRVQAE